MKDDKPKKSFDCVAFQREQRARLNAKMDAMGSEAFWDWLENREYSDPTLARLAAQAVPLKSRLKSRGDA